MTTAFYETGLAHFEAGLLPEAEQVCRDGLAQMPASGELQHLLGRVRLKLGDIPGAIELFREACAGIQEPEPFIDLGKALALLDDRVEAEAAYQSALRLNPGATEAHFHLGGLLAACGDLEAATLSYRQTIALEPQHVDAQCRLGSILLSLIAVCPSTRLRFLFDFDAAARLVLLYEVGEGRLKTGSKAGAAIFMAHLIPGEQECRTLSAQSSEPRPRGTFRT